jgi:hypothetical protein
MQVEADRAAQRPAPELPVDKRGVAGNKGHVTLQGERQRHATTPEDPAVTQLRVDWLEEAKLQT